MASIRYADPKATPEYIERERLRKRLSNREAWVKAWANRIRIEVEEERKHDVEKQR